MFFLSKGREDRSEFIRTFLAHSPIPMVEIDRNITLLAVNHAMRKLLGHHDLSSVALIGQPLLSFIHEHERHELPQQIARVFKASESETMHFPLSFPHMTKKGESIHTLVYSSPTNHENTLNAESLFLFFIDISDKKNLELRFVHSQKMQAVGQLAGGIAHDFNNLLTAIIGFCDLLLMRHSAGDPSFADIMQIKQNSNRAANLVRHLLAFSRKQTLQPRKIDLIDFMSDLSVLLRRLIGENIELNIDYPRHLWAIRVDQSQLEQVLINLAVNARDAMPSGGVLTIQIRDMSVKDASSLDGQLRAIAQEDAITAGDYAVITVTDNGTGIPDEVIDNIFEPFFTTKEMGHGTGLGLSTVYGIIKQTGGYIYFKSQEGLGTSFSLFVPRFIEEKETMTGREGLDVREMKDLTGTATILLVEDETSLRIFAVRALTNKGYHVLEADCAESAIEIYETHKDAIQVIITDVVMPGMNGPTMVELLDEKFADTMHNVHVIFMSGYTEDAFVDGYESNREFNFLSKPFTLAQLATKIKELSLPSYAETS
ncbi:MAG: response regulator [Alphaproteobacteria bacterium]|nr:MAG: response regulator [Alphaproteobacteria bacterium]